MITVLVAGLPGKMATLVAEAITLQKDMMLLRYALSGKSKQMMNINQQEIQLIPADNHANILDLNFLDIDVIVDFTSSKSANRNAQMYCEKSIPFIMGTTGGNRKELFEIVEKSNTFAIIANNMAIPIVIFQAMIQFVAENFQQSLNGFKIEICESHQAQKLGVSGTAESLLDSFTKLGIPVKKEQIVMIRDPLFQELNLGIPKQYLDGHGYHTYTLQSSDGTALLQFKHNILGRNIYVEGTLKAIRFLSQKKNSKGKVFSMIDVLKEISQ